MNYSFFEEYKKCIMCFTFAVLLLVVGAIFKRDFGTVIDALINMAIIGLGVAGTKYSVLKTSEREVLNAALPQTPDSEKYNRDQKPGATSGILPTILLALTFTAFLSGSVVITGCSSQYTYCVDCNSPLLSWQGPIAEVTGVWIKAGCFRLKLPENPFGDSLKVSDIISIDLKTGYGKFCDLPDSTTFEVKKLNQNSDSPDTSKVIIRKKDIILDKQ